MRASFSDRGGCAGGALSYPSDRLFEEIAYIAFHFHWPYEEIMNLDHFERARWVHEIVRIVNRLNIGDNSNESEIESAMFR
ncbi:MAG: DUF6760 family protein [Burkholderiaceae bacterium]